MKKIMIATAAAMLGIAANAASIAWSATAYNYVDAEGAVYTAATAPAGTFVLAYLGSGTADWSNAVVVNEGTVGFSVAMGSTTAKASGSYIVDVDTYKNGDIFGVMFKDAEGNLSQLEYVGGAKNEVTYTISGLKDEASTLSGFTFATANYTTAAVPEPTSGLLMLVGLAGLALRRRRA